ncbi:MAG: isoleucine--tRNA ligase [Bacteroidia bacterium]
MSKYKEYSTLNLTQTAEEIQQFWDEQKIFEKSITTRDENKPFVFFEGPPSANGLPGIHHVMARAIKDIFCRYKTLKGFQVKRKAGWDTHGLPVELGVEKELGITKEDIGKKISVDDYNKACREAVMRYTDVWNDLTKKMGYWVDMDDPYITYENKYIESVWWLLAQIYNKGLLYKGYTIQPYSPAAGTGLSSHELNQPGCYRDVKDTTVVAQFNIDVDDVDTREIFGELLKENFYFLAWTTTPWTLPSNSALAINSNIDYSLIKTFNQYTGQEVFLIVAKALLEKVLNSPYYRAETENELELYKKGDKKIPYVLIKNFEGWMLEGIKYKQLLPFAQPHQDAEKAFKVIPGDFVTTDDGTGIVHIAPTFGSDDYRVAKENGIPAMLVKDENGILVPLVDLQGRFRPEMGELAGMYVKNEYYTKGEEPEKSADVLISIKLKEENKAFKVEKYEHSYPHCWRTDKPVLYYPLDSWFIKVTDKKDRLVELNKTINWKPESTGTGRFGNWLENANDWNLSRSRYWGIPIPIWRTEDGKEAICIESVEQLKTEIEKAIAAGLMTSSPLENFTPRDFSKQNYETFDLHKNYVDNITLVSASGKPMKREADLIDVWFDSGSMPYAQWHYPFCLSPSLSQGEGEKSPLFKTASKFSYPHLKEKMQELKKNSTIAENALWEELRGKRLDEYKFRRQHVIAEFIVDFVCIEKALVIEVDGGYHNELEIAEADAQRTLILNQHGFKVIRFKNEEVLGGIDQVVATIKKELCQTPTVPKNAPPLGGDGGGFFFPADFIAEGVDQTRGWFYTLHTIATLVFDSVAYKNVISNGLVLDKNGQKMSKRLGNAVDPFETLKTYGADATRWYMITNAQPWDNLKFDLEGITEVQRKFFRALNSTYSFYALYANVDNFTFSENKIPVEQRPEIDRWVISRLNTLIKEVDAAYNDYEPTKAGRLIQDFVTDELSNWYVRLCRRRFWKGDYSEDKIAAYQTLYVCLETVAKLASPIAPFYSEQLFRDLNSVTKKDSNESVHLTLFPEYNEAHINKDLEEKMGYAQKISSLILSLRKKENIRVRQPLQKILVPIIDEKFARQIADVAVLIKSEVNVKEIETIAPDSGFLVKTIKPNFKALGPKVGKYMKQVSSAISAFSQEKIAALEQKGETEISVENETFSIILSDVEILSQDIPGWLVANEGKITVALDITITEILKEEGIAREMVNRIQNLRKDSGLEVTDKISLKIKGNQHINSAIENNKNYICTETLAKKIDLVSDLDKGFFIDLGDGLETSIALEKIE